MGRCGALTGLQLEPLSDLVNTNGATFYITGVQLEPGTVGDTV
jgi:hypothetical protein